ncbi:MAG TPA: metal ABC transporter substrate-binding protein, partial [Lachnoclostridium phytofermentans]|nr:metal ABC transporter substrate-binding protein [Lachnoclostridium phytofermentans]
MRKNKFKKALSVFLVLSMCVALAACGKKNSGNQSGENPNGGDTTG